MSCRRQWGAVVAVSSAVSLAVLFPRTLHLNRALAADDRRHSPVVTFPSDPLPSGLEARGVLHDSAAALARALGSPSAPMGLLSITTNTLGMIIARSVERSGRIFELTFDQSGSLIAQQVVGNVSALPVVSQTYVDTLDRARVVRDSSGSLIRVVTDPVDRLLAIGILRPQATASALGGSTGAVPVPASAPAPPRPGAGAAPDGAAAR